MTTPTIDPVESARAAGLRYVNDKTPGIRRRRVGKGFSYRASDGSPVREPQELERIASLGIPPAWNEVWISPWPDGHIQATGRDVKGRKQYRYHPRWRAMRDDTKYDRMLAFGAALPEMRTQIERDLRRPDLSRRKVLATVVRLLEKTLIRVGNAEYARSNESYGLTTLHDEHVHVEDSRVCFQFRGKSGKDHTITLKDRRLARIVRQCQELPGDSLFQYLDDGELETIDSSDVNEYLREISGQEFTAKDFRTWAGTITAALALERLGPAPNATRGKRMAMQAIKETAARLGNTPAICRKSYIHPAVIEAYLDGTLLDELHRVAEDVPELNADEDRVLAWLRRRLTA
ncbi:MAG: DNA topoisomerase IB [Chloroflexaceae bacterium]|jgi:DNA topoisomerase-1|nr:DNA topoisomerase IB [Chloroflexaceae bacterium]